jgi:hypothetical protein
MATQQVPRDRTIEVGALLFDYQGIDVVGPLDLLNMCGKPLMSAIVRLILPYSLLVLLYPALSCSLTLLCPTAYSRL